MNHVAMPDVGKASMARAHRGGLDVPVASRRGEGRGASLDLSPEILKDPLLASVLLVGG